MILIQLILLAAFAVLVVRFLANPHSYQMRAWQKIFGALFVVVAVVAVLLPEQANRAANAVGVGRGADLLLYLLTLAVIFVVFSLYVKNKRDQRQFVRLARRMAIVEANMRHSLPKKK